MLLSRPTTSDCNRTTSTAKIMLWIKQQGFWQLCLAIIPRLELTTAVFPQPFIGGKRAPSWKKRTKHASYMCFTLELWMLFSRVCTKRVASICLHTQQRGSGLIDSSLSWRLTHSLLIVFLLPFLWLSPLSCQRFPWLHQPVWRSERMATGQGAKERPRHGCCHFLQTCQPCR